METKSSPRLYYLDWLRVIGILTVFVYHSTRFFNLDSWHIKNATTYSAVQLLTSFLDVWMMPLIFTISGAALFYALGKPSLAAAGKFIKDKILRLLVPLLVNIFTFSMVQVYLERVTHGQFAGSLIDFLPHYYEGLYGFGGNFAFVGMHLWYVVYLFAFCLIFLPLFLFFKSRFGSRLLNGLTRIMAIPGVFYVLLALPVVLCETFLDKDSFLGTRLFSWSQAVFMLFFIEGFIIISSEKLQRTISNLRWISVIGTIIYTYLWIKSGDHSDMMCWFWVLTFIGFGVKYLSRTNRFLEYANPAVLPFYILHQTVLLMVGYVIIPLQIPDLLKWAIIGVSTFAISVGTYEYIIRRSNILRVLFGMKPMKKAFQPEAVPELTSLQKS